MRDETGNRCRWAIKPMPSTARTLLATFTLMDTAAVEAAPGCSNHLEKTPKISGDERATGRNGFGANHGIRPQGSDTFEEVWAD
jgi:hypothetical protein